MRTVLDAVLDQRWAMKPESFQALFDILGEHALKGESALAGLLQQSTERISNFHATGQTNEQAVQALKGVPLNEANQGVRLRGSTALLPVLGPIFPRANLFTMFSGASSVDSLARGFQAAMDDDRVQNIVLVADSPGGVITGISEFSDMVFDARNKKTIITFVEGYAASAMYWIGSSSSKMILADTAEVGSIGVVAGFVDTSIRDEKSGVKQVEIVSSQSPKKRLDPQTEEGRKEIQTVVDQLASVFIDKVARNRSVEASSVHSDFGQGGMFVAAEAVKRGMADSISSLEAVITNLETSTQSQIGGLFMGSDTKTKSDTVQSISVEEFQKSSPEAYKAIFESGKAEGIKLGVEQENARISSIEELAGIAGADKVLAEHKFDSAQTKDSLSTLILESQKQDRATAIDNLKKDGQAVGVKVGSVDQSPEESEKEELAAIIKVGAEAAGE